MSLLKDALNDYKNNVKDKVPAEVWQTMSAATEALRHADLAKKALKTGDSFPDFTLKNQHGEERRFSDYLKSGPVILNIYRGGWCPYCNLEMKAFHDILPEIKARGAQLVGMSPETPDHAKDTAQKADINIDILSDVGNAISQKLGLVFTLADELKPIYQQFGIDIPAFNGDHSFTLPMPATYLIDQQGKIVYHFIDVDYTQRQEPKELLALIPQH
ncbi:MAG: AhpC/TSA family protein [Betaproteobacteria bacterium]|nr:AhpC/TSA family protein [Betaproteobacteria bacterium]